jgi:hypothetical protein
MPESKKRKTAPRKPKDADVVQMPTVQPPDQPQPRHVVVTLTGDDLQIASDGVNNLEIPTLLRLAAVVQERKLGLKD